MWFRALGWLKAEKVLKYLFYTCSRIKSQDPTENGLRLRNTYTKETFLKLLKNLLAHKHNLTISALYHCSVYEPILGVKILFFFVFVFVFLFCIDIPAEESSSNLADLCGINTAVLGSSLFQNSNMPGDNCRIFLGNLPSDCRVEDIEDFFRLETV